VVSSTSSLPLFFRAESINNKYNEEYRVLENMVLGRIFVFKREEVIECWREMNSSKLHN
jgi:hypothetical protein